MASLEKRGATVSYHDPHVPLIREGRHNQAVAGKKCVPITDEYDVILLCTNHEVYKTTSF